MNSLYQQMQNQVIQNNLTNNPQLQQVMSMVKASKMTPKEYFYSLAKQRGIDPQQVLNQVQSMLK